MSGVRTRLTYNDSSDETVVIGRMLTGENDNITTCTIKDSAEGWNQLVIEGNQVLQENLPVSESEFGTARNGEEEPEILLEVFRNDEWEVRDRFYATEGGAVDDTGFYKNNSLYGHGKYIGEQRVEITDPISGDISDGMEALLPDGYSLQAPDDIDIPSLTDYTFKGKRENGFLDLANPHNWVLVFTADLDENNNYIVRFEPKGYGDEEGTIIRGVDAFSYDYWKKKDTKTVVSEVTVLGNTAAGDTVEETVTAEDPDIKRSLTKRVGYPITEAEAEEIGEDLLQPSFVEHGALEGPLFIDNTVNFSVGIVDETRNIDDVFTVVEQRDYLHQGETYFSFIFEKEANIKENFMRKGVREERDALFGQGEDTINIDFDEFDAENSTAEADNATSEDDESPDISASTGVAFGDAGYNYASEDPTSSISDGGTASASTTVPDLPSLSAEMYLVSCNISVYAVNEDVSGDIDVIISNTSNDDTLFDETLTLVGVTGEEYRFGNRSMTIIERDPGAENDDIELEVTNNTGNTVAIGLDLTVDAIREHDHSVSGSTDSHNHNVSVLDGGHGGSGDPSEHVITGEQAEQLIELLQQFQTDR